MENKEHHVALNARTQGMQSWAPQVGREVM